MKHFIYIDNDIINSYMSQFNNRLLINTNDKTLSQILDTVVGINSENKDQLTSSINLITKSKSGTDLVNKMFYDNAFNELIKYLCNRDLLKQSNYSIGDYVSIKDTFELWDLNYLLTIFSGDLVDYFIKNDMDIYTAQFIICNKGKEPSKNSLNKYEKERNEFYEQIRNALEVCIDVLPFTKFMLINDFLVPLDESYLEKSINKIKFEYTGEITLIGQYTNNYKGTLKYSKGATFSQTFDTLNKVINKFFKDSFNISDYSKVIIPIALYFE